MLVLLYILNLLAPIVNFVGLLGLCGCIVYEDLHILVMFVFPLNTFAPIT